MKINKQALILYPFFPLLALISLFKSSVIMSMAFFFITLMLFSIYLIIEFVNFKDWILRVAKGKTSYTHLLIYLYFLFILSTYVKAYVFGQIVLFKMLYWISVWFIVIFVAIFIGNDSFQKTPKTRSLKYIFNSLYIYVLINFILYILGFTKVGVYGDYAHANGLFSLVGLKVSSVLFLLAPGINSYGAIVGASFITAIEFYRFSTKRKEKLWYFICVIISFLSIILTDSKGPLLFSIITFLFIRLSTIRIKNTFYGLILIIPILIPLLLFVLPGIMQVDRIPGLIKNQGFLLSGREVIWYYFFDYFKEPQYNILFGYGLYGQALSGISQNYSYLFTSWDMENALFMTLHNFVLQNIVDIGLIGTLLLYILLYKNFKQLKEIMIDKKLHTILFAFFFYLIASGSTELTLNQYNVQLVSIFIILSYTLSIKTIKD